MQVNKLFQKYLEPWGRDYHYIGFSSTPQFGALYQQKMDGSIIDAAAHLKLNEKEFTIKEHGPVDIQLMGNRIRSDTVTQTIAKDITINLDELNDLLNLEYAALAFGTNPSDIMDGYYVCVGTLTSSSGEVAYECGFSVGPICFGVKLLSL